MRANGWCRACVPRIPRRCSCSSPNTAWRGIRASRLDRKSLLVQIGRVMDQVVREELLSDKVKSLARWTANALTPSFNAPRVPAAAAITPPAGPVAAGTGSPLLALVVDDSATLRLQVRNHLRQCGIACHEAEDAEQAMSRIAQQWYDLALFDVMMPGVDGYELCRRIKHDPRTRSLPVVMITSRSSPFDRARGALVGCDSYLVKPVVAESFHRAIDAALGKAFKYDRASLTARGYAGLPRA